MARTPDGDEPRTEFLRCRITPTEKRLVDKMRGGLSESDWHRGLIHAEAKRRGVQ